MKIMPNDFKQFRPEPLEEAGLEENISKRGDRLSLNKGSFQSRNFVRGKAGYRLNEDGLAEFLDINLGDRFVVVDPDFGGAGINGAIERVANEGGGTVFLKAGTFTASSNITLRSSVALVGQKESTSIIDFSSNSNSLIFEDSDVYTTGTITSISGGVNVTGSGTSWLANVSAGQYLFLANRHYKIAAVTSNTTLILSDGYVGNASLPGASYRISTILTDVDFREFTVKSSGDDGMYLRGCKNITMSNLTFLQNNVGFDWDNVTENKIDNVVVTSSTSDGVQMTNVGFGDIEGLSSVSNGGNGYTLNNLETMPFFTCATNANTGDGINATDVIKCPFIIESRANGGQGIEFVSGCDKNFIDKSLIIANTSDGIKLTATSDRNILGQNVLDSNGGYGINIAASTCDKNLIHDNQFISNSSGTVNDSGTGTVQADNVT